MFKYRCAISSLLDLKNVPAGETNWRSRLPLPNPVFHILYLTSHPLGSSMCSIGRPARNRRPHRGPNRRSTSPLVSPLTWQRPREYSAIPRRRGTRLSPRRRGTRRAGCESSLWEKLLLPDVQLNAQLSLRLQDHAARGNKIPVFHALAHARLPNLELHLETVGQVDLLAFAPREAPSAASPFLHLYIKCI